MNEPVTGIGFGEASVPISLRDYFAAHMPAPGPATAATIEACSKLSQAELERFTAEVWARWAYAVADALLTERARKGEP